MNQIMKVTAIKYVGYPYTDTRREDLKDDDKKYYDTFLDQLTNSPWSNGRITEKPVALITTKEPAEHIFLAPNTFFILGSDSLYRELSDIRGFDLSKNALIFLEEKKNTPDITQFPDSKILLYKKNLLDLTLEQVHSNNLIFPARQLQFDPDTTGWWKREAADLISLRAFLQDKYGFDNLDFDYGGGWAISEGESSKFKVQSPNLEKGTI